MMVFIMTMNFLFFDKIMTMNLLDFGFGFSIYFSNHTIFNPGRQIKIRQPTFQLCILT